MYGVLEHLGRTHERLFSNSPIATKTTTTGEKKESHAESEKYYAILTVIHSLMYRTTGVPFGGKELNQQNKLYSDDYK